MMKFFKIFFVLIIIFACSCFGIKLYNNNNLQVDFSPQNTTTATIPISFDLRDYIDIGVENQNPFGICYAFASLTSIETYLALNYNEYYDFSEMHFATSLYLQDNYYSSISEALSSGGNFSHFTLYTQKTKSLVLEQEMPMSDYLTLSSSTRETRLINDFNTINNNFYQLVKVNDTKSYKQYVGNKNNYTANELNSFRQEIKTHIMNYGSVTAGIYTGGSFNYSTINYKITDDSLVADQSTINSNTNHLISIVGWDDEYDANGAWANKGAYICLNSWGTEFGEDGYFYVSYDDYFIESCIQGVTNATLSTTNNKISPILDYQNKTAIYNHVFSQEPTLYTANIYDTSSYIGEKITYIDTFIKGGLTKFYIKFFDSKVTALANINSVNSQISTTKIDDYTLYTKYQLTSPLSITGNYMLVIREVEETIKTHSLAGPTIYNLGIEPTYWQGAGLGHFDTSTDIWNPGVTGKELDYTIPMIFHTDKKYIEVSAFESSALSVINGSYVKNNATFKNKPLHLTLNNANLSSSNLSNITITKLYSSNIDVTSKFEFNLNNSTLTISMTGDLGGGFTTGEYLITIPCGNTTIYRMIEVQDVVSYSIEYHLNGGQSNNPSVYTNKQTSLNLNTPIKNGFTFVGWYTDSDFTKSFDTNNLPYTNLVLYAKYDFATPTITNKSQDVSITYYNGINVTINITASHGLLNEYNTLSYQWYKRANLTDNFNIVDGATNSSLTLNTVAQAGYYCCAVTISITDPSLVDSTITKTLLPSQDNAILVNIKPYIYDMSKVQWSYNEAISYDTNTHTITLLNLPAGVTATYSNNSHSEVGTYIASATLNYDNMNGNAIANEVEDLTWKIRKSKITITIDDIFTSEELSQQILNTMYSCHIENEYLPNNITSFQEKLDYLNLQYILQNTSNENIKIINANTNNFDIHDIIIIAGEYRVIVNTLTSNNIIANNERGFVKNCIFTSSSQSISEDTNSLLTKQNFSLVESYNLSFSYLQDDEAEITIPFDRSLLLNNLSVYMIKNGEIVKLDSKASSQGLTFVTTEQTATYIIVKEDIKYNSNSQFIVLVIIISIYIGLYVFAIVSKIKHKDN